MKKGKGKKTNEHLKRAAKGLFCSGARDKDDGMVPCPYCQKKFEPLSLHQYTCQSKPSDEKDVKNSARGPTLAVDIDEMVPCPYCKLKFEPLSMHQYTCPLKPSDENMVKNATKGPSCSDAGDEDDERNYFFSEPNKKQDTENDGTLLSPSDEAEFSEIINVLSGLFPKKEGVSCKSKTKEFGVDSQSETTEEYANDRGMSHLLKTYDEDAFKIATKDLTWIDSSDSSGDEYHKPAFSFKPLGPNHMFFYERKESSSDSSDIDSDQDGYLFETPECLKEVMATLSMADEYCKEQPSSGDEDGSKYDKHEVVIKEEETDYCLEKINALMSNLLQKLHDRTQLSWVKMNSGSHYSNVKLPNEMEFDYMLCPTQVQCRIEPSSDHHCYCRVFITNKLKLPLEFQEILGPHDELTPSKFKEYVFGILDKIRPKNQLLNRVENKTVCPAYTVDYKIGRSYLNRKLCIDWVPCLEVQEPPNYCTEWKTRLLTEEEKKACPLYVVAKNFDDDGEELELWRLSYSVFELKILRDKCTEEDRNVVKVLKHIMKLVTKENNRNNNTIRICSYHVMSQCLRYFEDTPQRPVGKNYLLDVIAYLIIAVHSKDIRHFFIPSFNLMHDVENEEIEQFKLRFYYYKKELRKYKPGRFITPIIRLCGQLGLITVKKP